MNLYDLIIVGTGPAGLSAAFAASERGKRVLLLERAAAPSIKLLSSGGGRCNFSNTLLEQDFMRAFGAHGRFMSDALRVGGKDWLLPFLKQQGVGIELADDGRSYFPSSRRASDIRDAFLLPALRSGTVLLSSSQVLDFRKDSADGFFLVRTSEETYQGRALLLAAGGTAMPSLGGSDAGLRLAQSAGHCIVPTGPALAPLLFQEAWVRARSGVSLPDVRLTCGSRREQVSTRGELLFTHDGFSGPAAIDLSCSAYALWEKYGSLAITFSADASRDEPAWKRYWEEARTETPKRGVRKILAQSFPASLAEDFCLRAQVPDFPVCRLSAAARDALCRLLAGQVLSLNGICPMTKAMAMRGGVELKEVDPKTLMSRIMPGLFFAGEILNLTGPCGGFNIQFAIASGRLAGISAAEDVADRGGTVSFSE